MTLSSKCPEGVVKDLFDNRKQIARKALTVSYKK